MNVYSSNGTRIGGNLIEPWMENLLPQIDIYQISNLTHSYYSHGICMRV